MRAMVAEAIGCFLLVAGVVGSGIMADHLAVLNMPMAALKRSATVTSFDPLTLLPALAMVTEHLGLIATASTTFEPPYLIARRFASLDHISGGRAGWNLVTTSNPDSRRPRSSDASTSGSSSTTSTRGEAAPLSMPAILPDPVPGM